MLDILMDSLTDTVKMLPFLFVACLLVEAAEHRRSAATVRWLENKEKGGYVVGAALGIVPQCGFCAMAADLYAARMITVGTLISVFISASDEAFFVLAASADGRGALLRIVIYKFVIAVLAGFVLDVPLHGVLVRSGAVKEHGETHCPCEHAEGEKSIWLAALLHTAEVAGWVFVSAVGISLLFSTFAGELFKAWLAGAAFLQPVFAALIGLIPNCAASVLLAQLYLSGTVNFASLAAGLCSATGVGLMVLARSNRPRRENLRIILVLFIISCLAGFLASAVGL